MEECGRVKEDLVELLFGELDEKRAVEVNMHLALCETCRREEESLLRLKGKLRKEIPPPGPELRERIRGALPARHRNRFVRMFCTPIPAYAAVAASLILALMVRGLPAENKSGGDRRLIAAGDLGNVQFVPAGSFETSPAAFHRIAVAESSFAETGLPPVDSL